MTTEYQIRDEKLLYDIKKEAAKISALPLGKIDKYEYLAGVEILPSNQQQIIEQAKFSYSSLGKPFLEEAKSIKDLGEKQVDALKSLKPEEVKPKETKPFEYGDYFLNGLAEIKHSTKIDFNNSKYTFKDENNNPIDFIGFKVPIHIFKSIYNGSITLEDKEKDQTKLKSDLGH